MKTGCSMPLHLFSMQIIVSDHGCAKKKNRYAPPKDQQWRMAGTANALATQGNLRCSHYQ